MPQRPRNPLLVCLATYNELENLPRLVDQIERCGVDADLLVIDDNSPDGTADWCQQYAADHPQFHFVRRPGKLGLGTAAITGMQYALQHRYKWLLTMDADFSHSPSEIPLLVAAMDGDCDVAIGSRYLPGGAITGWPLRRRVSSRAVNLLARLLLRLPTHDNSGQFRCYRVDVLRHLDWQSIQSRDYSFFEEILWRLHRQGARLKEVPIHFIDRQQGESKLRAAEAIRSVSVLFRLAWRERCGSSQSKPVVAPRRESAESSRMR